MLASLLAVIPSRHGEAVVAAAGDRGRFVPVHGATHETVFHAAFADPEAAAILRAFLAPSAEDESHAENAESAEPDSHAESAESGSHAEFAESDPHAESAED